MNQNSLGSVDDLLPDDGDVFTAKLAVARKKYRILTLCVSVVLVIAISLLVFGLCARPAADNPSLDNKGLTTQPDPTRDSAEGNTQATVEHNPVEESTQATTNPQPVQLEWSGWSDSLPEHVNEESFAVEEQILYRSRNLETTSSTTKNSLDGWELYDTIQGSGNFGKWSDWSATAVSATGTREVETQTRYRHRDTEMTSGSSSTMSGWELYNTTYSWGNYGPWSGWSTSAVSNSDSRKVETKTQYCYRDISYSTEYTGWGSWSSWQDSAVSETDLRKVETRTVYEYYYYACPGCGVHLYGWDFNCFDCGTYIPTYAFNQVWGTTPQSQMGFKPFPRNTNYTYANYNGQIVFRSRNGDNTKTQYRYATRSTRQVANYGSWSSWGDTAYSSSSSREVQTRTVYRYCDRSQIPTYYFWRWGNWSDWSTNAATGTDSRQVETATYYRYRDRVTTTTYYFRRWGDWSEYLPTAVTKSDTVDVETKTQYRYKSK